jgi:cytochrome c peroxidase
VATYGLKSGGAPLAVLAIILLTLAGSAAGLTPPTPFVLGSDGVTQQTLEQAGILNSAVIDGKTARQWAVLLGKTFFWDQQGGSDGNACASCHFHAGADVRRTNQINPGFNDITKTHDEDGEEKEGDVVFGSERSDLDPGDPLYVAPGQMPSGAWADANYTLTPDDMPLHQLVDERDRNSAVRTTTNDRVSSQGSFDTLFTKVKKKGKKDKCKDLDDSVFHVGSYAARQVEPRNTPTTINAAFFHRNFWDARANNLFNGVGVFGMRDILGDPNKRLIIRNETGGLDLGWLELENASLASQAVGPPLSTLEMSCDGRTFADVGRKLLAATPLAKQKIDPTDSVLGPYVDRSGKGLASQHKYAALIQRAFDPKYWDATGKYKIVNGQLRSDKKGYTQMEINFPMFWGIAIMLYELTLVSDQSEFDTYGVTNAASCFNVTSPTGGTPDALWQRGCQIFFSAAGTGNGIGGNCSVCHGGTIPNTGNPARQAVLSQAAFQAGQAFGLLIQVPKNLGGVHRHDLGVMSIGLRPVFTDLLNGGEDPYGNPLSLSRQYQSFLQDGTPIVDPFLQRLHDAGGPFGFGVTSGQPAPVLGVDGAAKAPILRNVGLTPPYFSWGGYPDLRQAMKLYNRGVNRRDITASNGEAAVGTACTSGDNTGTGPDGNQEYPLDGVADCNSNTTATILALNLLDCDPEFDTGLPPAVCTQQAKDSSNDDLAALVRFLKSLTDPRVQCDKAPFDHPQLHITDGHRVKDANGNGKADDIEFSLPAVGAAGYTGAKAKFCIPNAADLFAPEMQSRSGG